MSADFVEPLHNLAGSHFYAVTFVLDHLQLQFDGPHSGEDHFMTVEAHPRIQVGDLWLAWRADFRDALCNQLRSTVRQARTDIEGEQILFEFDTGARFSVSLRIENTKGYVAADYHHCIGQERLDGALWAESWKDDWKRLYTAKE
jgi:hypothetical protein